MRCFVDMDGVLVDFVGAALRRHERRVDEWPPGEFNMAKVLGIPRRDFWGPLEGAEFWATLEPTAEAHELMAVLEAEFGSWELCILSSPTRDPQCSAGKVQWLQRCLPDYSRRFLLGPEKRFCAGPDSLLIDDADHNVDRFREAGGCGILFPRPWNRLHAVTDPLAHVVDCIGRGDWHAEPESDEPVDLESMFSVPI
ncbi:MAG: 5'(3')-deoxyribonucleotidase [Rhodothermales bacterium]|jgi:5'(3')-deoxyribonucleotidase